MKFVKQIAFYALLLALSSLAAVAQETGGAKGKVRGPKGESLSGVMVTARVEGEEIKSVRSDNKGNFLLAGLKPGVYNFVFEKSGYATGVKFNVEVTSGRTANLGDRLILSVDQGTLVLIRGSVFDQDGRSVTGAKVEIERINSDGSTRKVGTAYTNVSGDFAFRQREGAARFRVTASARGANASKEVVVDSAAIYRLALTLNLQKNED